MSNVQTCSTLIIIIKIKTAKMLFMISTIKKSSMKLVNISCLSLNNVFIIINGSEKRCRYVV